MAKPIYLKWNDVRITTRPEDIARDDGEPVYYIPAEIVEELEKLPPSMYLWSVVQISSMGEDDKGNVKGYCDMSLKYMSEIMGVKISILRRWKKKLKQYGILFEKYNYGNRPSRLYTIQTLEGR